MNPITAAEAAQQPLVTDADVQERVTRIVGRACRRQVWLLFTDERDIQLRGLVAMDDYPTSPLDGHAEVFAARIKDAMDAHGAAQVIFVWERHVSERATPADRAWAKAMARACGTQNVSVRAQLISHRSGVRWFPPDDYL